MIHRNLLLTYINIGGDILNQQNNNMDLEKMMAMLSKMDKKQLQEGLAKASKILESNDKNAIIDEIKKNTNQK